MISKLKQASLRDYENKDINLIPKEYFRRKKLIYRFFIISFLAILIIGSAGGYYYHLTLEIGKLDEERLMVEERINKLTKDKNEQDIFLELENRVNDKLKFLEEIEKNNVSINFITGIIERNLPKDIIFLNMNTNSEGNVTINGLSSSDVSIAELIHNLKDTNFFTDVFVGNITTNQINGVKQYSFSLVCQYRRK